MNHNFYNILLSNLSGKKWKRHYPLIFYNLMSVNEGLKPSFLWDVGPQVDPRVIHLLIENLKTESFLKSSVNVITFENQIFIINLECVCQYLSNYSNYIKFVDCSLMINEPIVIETNCRLYQKIYSTLQILAKKLLLLLKIKNYGLIDLKLKCDNEFYCPVTIFGVLLGYPIVYWSQDFVNGNCLSCVPLTVFKIYVNKFNFSEISNNRFSNCNTLYSFSAPSFLSLDCFVDAWIASVNIFSNIEYQLRKENVVLPCIVL